MIKPILSAFTFFVMRFFIVGIFVALVGCQPIPKDQEHFSKGFSAYEKGDYYTALLYLKPLVEEGNPAAQLLLAKMYANGQGVQEDMGKAELLRNLAATKVYSHTHAPGTLRPANETLKAVSDRLDFLTRSDQADGPKDLPQLLASLDLNSLKQLGTLDSENSSESQSVQVPVDSPPAAVESAPPVETPTQDVLPPPSSTPASPLVHDVRRADQISLRMLHQAAERGDPFAMKLLSAAYAKGFYGLARNPIQAALWRQKALSAPKKAGDSDEDETMFSVPVAAMAGAGILLVSLGLWRFQSRRRKKG